MSGMTRKAIRAIGTFAAAGGMFIATMPFAGAGAPTLSVKPDSVHAGADVDITGNCSGGQVIVGIYAGTITGNTAPTGKALASTDLSLDGSNWDSTMTVPPGTPAGQYTVNSACRGEGTYYTNIPLTVLPDDTTTTTSTTVAPTTTTGQPAVKAATAVPAKPTYTG